MRPSSAAIAAGPARRRCGAPPSSAVALEAISPGEVLRFFASFPPLTPAGHAYQAFALQSTGRSEEARAAARRAWTAGVLPLDVEQRLLARVRRRLHPGRSRPADGGPARQWRQPERGADPDLGAGGEAAACTRRGSRCRPAPPTPMTGSPRSIRALRRDGGLLIDQAIWLRNGNQSAAARRIARRARPVRPAGRSIRRAISTRR